MAQLAQQHYRMLFKTGLHTMLSTGNRPCWNNWKTNSRRNSEIETGRLCTQNAHPVFPRLFSLD